MTNVLRLALAALLLFPQLAAAQSPELVRNGSFAGGLSPWWQQGTGVRVQQVDGRSAAVIVSGMIVQEKIAVTGGRNYQISMDIRGEATTAGTVYVQASFRGPGVSTEWRGPAQARIDDRSPSQCGQPPASSLRTEKAVIVTGGGQAEWRQHSLVIAAPANSDQLVLYLRKGNCSPGAAAYTNVSITETNAPPTSGAELARRALAAERLPKPAIPEENRPRLDAQLSRSAPSDGQYRLAAGGATKMKVHVAGDEDLITLQAAVDFSDFLAKIVGAPAPAQLSTDAAVASDTPLLVVGRKNAFAARAFTESEFTGLGEDGFLIRSMGPHILIAGATPRGTMYGVNWFLDHKLGIRWFSPSVTYWPSKSDISLSRQNERQVPRFDFREVLSAEADNHRWRQRNLMNGLSHGPSFGTAPLAIDSWNRSWAAAGTIPNFYELLPEAKYRAAHPDWYAGGQLAMMNKAMRAEMARVVIERLRALPDYRKVWFSIHDMDWGWDMDPASAAFAAQHGGYPSAPRLDMMIEVANLVRQTLPGARLAFNAYHWSFTPPEGMSVPDYILVYPMTIYVNYRDGLNGPANAELGRDIAGWQRIARHVLVWDHITNFAGFLQPTPNLIPINDSIKWLASLDHVEGYMGEGSFDTPGAEFAALRAWMISRLLWDPQQDPWALIADFCGKYYGPAAPFVIDYIRFIHDKLARTDDVLAEKTTVDMAMFDAEFVRRSEALFNQAEAAVAGTEYLNRVRAARMPVDYVILRRGYEYASQEQAIGFSITGTRAARLERFLAAVKTEKVSQYMQGGSVAELTALLNVVRKPAGKPDLVGDLPEWKDIQDISFQRFAGTDSAIVSDPLASDGAAVSLARKWEGWNTQLKFDKLPKSGEWWLYAAVRSEGAAGNEAIAKVGSAPPMGCAVTVRNSPELAAGYNWVEVPGGPFRYSADHARSIYVQPIKGANGSKVLVDRILALPKRASGGFQPAPTGSCG